MQRYIATWRGIATDFALFRDFRSLHLQLVVVGHELLDDLDRDGLVFLREDVRSTSCASASVMSWPVSEAYATRRISDPSSSRMFDLILLAM